MKCYGLGFNQYSGQYTINEHQDPRDERGKAIFSGIEDLLNNVGDVVKRGKTVEIRVASDFPLDKLELVKVALQDHKANYVFLDDNGNIRPTHDLEPDSE